jgi:hypothetical protein
MALNMKETYEMIVRGKTLTPVPGCIPSTERKTCMAQVTRRHSRRNTK